MNLIKWIWQRRHIGLRFSANGNALLLGMVDASNKPDRADGKCQYGFYIFLAGAPVLDISKKLRHIGLSSEHNEYMTLCFANQAVVWLRQLFKEMGLLQFLEKPTVMLADNIPANTLSMEDIVTTGNQYIYLPYHYNKEVQEDGFVKVKYVKSVMNISDLTTKAVDRQTMKRLEPSATGYDLRLLNELMKLAYD
jgi:hypothetical protein